MNNYRKLNNTLFKKIWYVYVDADNNSQQLMDDLGIKTKKEMIHMDYVPYSFKCVKIPVSKEKDFLDSMEKLKKKLILLGYSSYEEKSEEMFKLIKL